LGRPPAIVWVAGYSSGYFGYIRSERVLAEGGYEAPAYAAGIEAVRTGSGSLIVRHHGVSTIQADDLSIPGGIGG